MARMVCRWEFETTAMNRHKAVAKMKRLERKHPNSLFRVKRDRTGSSGPIRMKWWSVERKVCHEPKRRAR